MLIPNVLVSQNVLQNVQFFNLPSRASDEFKGFITYLSSLIPAVAPKYCGVTNASSSVIVPCAWSRQTCNDGPASAGRSA